MHVVEMENTYSKQNLGKNLSKRYARAEPSDTAIACEREDALQWTEMPSSFVLVWY